jgi:hypothetical protein
MRLYAQTDQDILDLLAILSAMETGNPNGKARMMIVSMRDAVEKRGNTYVSSGIVASHPKK